MVRPPREFRAESFELEGRLLLARAHAAIHHNETVLFASATSAGLAPGSTSPTQEVGQQDGSATVVLSRSSPIGTTQVRVTTDPLSPAVGVNVDAVDQTVTFRNYQRLAAVTVPLVAGAPNPGEVDVNLIITPVTPNVTTSGPATLRILASDATIPPTIVSVQGKRQGIVLTFNKPMNPVGASNLNNYAVSWTSSHSKYADLGSLAYLIPGQSWPPGLSVSSGSAHLESARYDPATNSVTLTTKQVIHYSTRTTLSVSVGQPDVSAGQSATTTVRPVQKSNPGPGLTDLEGNPIISAPGATPGYFSYTVSQGFQPTP
jgi:hypothetical protein